VGLALLDASVVGEGEVASPTGTPPSFASEDAQLAATLEALDTIAGSAGAGLLARFYGADVQVRLGQKDAAIKALRTLAGELSTKDNLYFLAVERLAHLLEESGAAEDAIKELERLSAPGGSFYRDAAAFQIARIHQAQGRTDQARLILSGFKTSFPDSPLNSDVAERLAALGDGSSPEEK
jgi:predicted negative regulator of RcsB-dependent stress response